MKFGGSSVADADKIRRVADGWSPPAATAARWWAWSRPWARPRTTWWRWRDEVSPRPHPREMDMLLSTGERISAALCAMAIEDLGHRAVSLTGSQAGIVTDTAHTKAKIVDIRPRRITEALAEGKIVLVAGFQGVSTAYDVTTLGRGASDLSAVALAAALGGDLRDLHRRGGRVHGRSADRARRATSCRAVSPPRCSRWPAPGARGAAATIGRVRPQPRRAHPRALDLLRRRGNLDPRGPKHGRRNHLRHHPQRSTRPTSRSPTCPTSRAPPPASSTRSRRRTSTSTRSSRTLSRTATPTSPSRSRATSCR